MDLITCMTYEWKRRAQDSILNGSLTNSKRPESFVSGVYPTHIAYGNGCFLYDTNGKRYVDFICGMGAHLFGYNNSFINNAIEKQLRKGTIFSLSSTKEVEAAEKLKEYVPFISKLRFLKTGTEACLASIRIARAVTGRKKVLSDGYHGWTDEFVSMSPPASGINEQDYIDKLTFIEQIDETVAAVIVEPIVTDWSPKRIEFLNKLREACTENGVVLIFDEIITGFRWPSYTVSQYYGITPDIICLGKALGGGLPLSVVGVTRSIELKANTIPWFVSGTFYGECLSLTAMQEIILLQSSTEPIKNLWEDGHEFMMKFNSLWPDGVWLEGYPTRSVLKGKTDLIRALFMQETCRAGMLFGPSFFYSYKHKEHAQSCINSIRDILMRIKTGVVTLEGDMPQTPFAQKQRE